MDEKQYDDLMGVLDGVIRAVEHAKRQVSQYYYREQGALAPGDVVLNKPVRDGGNPGMPQGVQHTIKEVLPSPWVDQFYGIGRTHYYVFEPGPGLWTSAWTDQVVRA